jgi:MYND finger/SET domain
MDPSQCRFCTYCYAEMTGKVSRCGRCKKRTYCSKECQVKDWKEASHKVFCKKSGEIGHDYEIRSAGEKGLGMFALRDYKANEVIMVERPVLKGRLSFIMAKALYPAFLSGLPAGPAIAALHPLDGSFEEKMAMNATFNDYECDDTSPDLTIVMSRINHDCLANAVSREKSEGGIPILQAKRNIRAGEEITRSYTAAMHSQDRKDTLRDTYGFECQCKACTDISISDELDLMFDLRRAMKDYGMIGSISMALWAGESLIQLYGKYKKSSLEHSELYFELYHIAITQKRRYQKAVHYVKKAYQSAVESSTNLEEDVVQVIWPYFKNPRRHPHYGYHD